MDMESALKTFNIKNEVSILRLKRIYRELVKQYHPDIKGSEDKIAEINNAYDFLIKYMENYNFTISELKRESIEERTFKRFKNDWLGGNLNE